MPWTEPAVWKLREAEVKGRWDLWQLPKAESVHFPHKVVDSKYLSCACLTASAASSQLSLLQHKESHRHYTSKQPNPCSNKTLCPKADMEFLWLISSSMPGPCLESTNVSSSSLEHSRQAMGLIPLDPKT